METSVQMEYVACLEPDGHEIKGYIRRVEELDKLFDKMSVRWLMLASEDYSTVVTWVSREGWYPVVVDDVCWLI